VSSAEYFPPRLSMCVDRHLWYEVFAVGTGTRPDGRGMYGCGAS
jgi:hypothetical protein